MVSKKNPKSVLRSVLAWGVGICLFACLVFLFPFVKDSLLHDMALNGYVRSVKAVQHPENTSSVAFRKKVGLMWGNGNHCNYFAGELRRYTGERAAIESFYAPQLADDSSLSLTFPENGRFPGNPDEWLPYDMTDLSTWLESPTTPRAALYLISTWGIDLDPGWDLRCG
jgi:hypothetical protein